MELRLAATMDALLLRTLDCSGSDLLPSDDSSLGFTADFREAWFFFDGLSPSILPESNSSLVSTASDVFERLFKINFPFFALEPAMLEDS